MYPRSIISMRTGCDFSVFTRNEASEQAAVANYCRRKFIEHETIHLCSRDINTLDGEKKSPLAFKTVRSKTNQAPPLFG
jgi:hypothetical protein